MSRKSDCGLDILVVGLVAFVAGIPAAAQAPAPSTQQAPATQPAVRGPQQIMADYRRVGTQLQQLLSLVPATQPAQRQAVAPKVLPLLREMLGYAEELDETGDPGARMFADNYRWAVTQDLAYFGDDDAVAELKRLAESANATDAKRAKLALLTLHWSAAETPEQQLEVVEQIRPFAAANPEDQDVAQFMLLLLQTRPPLDVMERMAEVAIETLPGPAAGMVVESVEAYKVRQSLLGKPLTLSGVTAAGDQLSTESLKGKVILVDFWATWCGPCVAEMPQLVELYNKYRDQGLQIVGVSSDQTPAMLDRYLAQHPQVGWPQLFDRENPGQHALADRFGVVSYPTMFLIDREGIVRSVDARGSYRTEIPKLLAE